YYFIVRFSFVSTPLHGDSHSFPTRRSSDLASLDVVHGFSSAVRCDDLIFVGGKMAVDGEGRVLNSEDIVAQARTTMDNLKRAIKDRKSTRLNSSHVKISYAVFCLKKKNKTI